MWHMKRFEMGTHLISYCAQMMFTLQLRQPAAWDRMAGGESPLRSYTLHALEVQASVEAQQPTDEVAKHRAANFGPLEKDPATEKQAAGTSHPRRTGGPGCSPARLQAPWPGGGGTRHPHWQSGR